MDILIVDDMMYPVKQLNQFLRNSGFDVTEIDEGLKYQI
jgi:DNA-binding response OmpR family regulator